MPPRPKSSMEGHIERVYRKKDSKTKHSCQICTKIFASRNGMKRHENEIHHLPKKCPYCYRAIRRLPNLRLHVKAQHGTELGTVVMVDIVPAMDEALSLASSSSQASPVTPSPTTDVTLYDPESSSIRLGYAPLGQNSLPLDPSIPIGHATSNILETRAMEQTAFGYVNTPGQAVADFGPGNWASSYNPALQMGQLSLSDGYQMQPMGWTTPNGALTDLNDQLLPVGAYYGPVGVDAQMEDISANRIQEMDDDDYAGI
ncbi:C2H2 and C2HC zinc finger [Glarea lozoyensis ATCC 20868]|uniref:C2H2 and C2HC zinc finger n=1 Tax=Glarea lozoyensis (strain ATCC 20868 / MF5171) TaxID=1116229 RepID=S3DIG1_GLAL2|nr:C2H2 and C2HC zinc finger [Glarea lozoyensis ATCC 20868]EPE36944.1 C2H2 and C2HC zinc finger [Glarea lozoyensis ATCC 20868]